MTFEIKEKVKELNYLLTIGNYEKVQVIANEHIKNFPKESIFFNINGIALINLKKIKEAIYFFQRAVDLKQDYFEAYNNLANALKTDNNNKKAIYYYSKAIIIKPGFVEPYYNLACLLGDIGQYKKSISNFNKAIKINPKYLVAYYNLGCVLMKTNNFDKAIDNFNKVIIINPKFVKAYINLGISLKSIGKLNEAIVTYNKIIKINPKSAEVHNNIGNVYREQSLYNLAINNYDKAIKLQPKYVEAICNLGVTYQEQGKFDKAKKYFDRALSIFPDDQNTKYNLSLLNLSKKNFIHGWQEYEFRKFNTISNEQKKMNENFIIDKNIINKKILILKEQGIGDEILFSSIFNNMTKLCPNVTIECNKKLKNIFKRSFPNVKKFLATNNKNYKSNILKKFDYIFFAGSLGKIFRRNIREFPKKKKFLLTDRKKDRSYKKYLNYLNKNLKIGISWISKNEKIGKYKTIPLIEFDNIISNKNLTFINLQYGECKKEMNDYEKITKNKIVDIPKLDKFNDLDSLASLINSLDLVITVSNVTAHIAAALGKKTWVIVPKNKARLYYWTKDNYKTPWYPSVRIIEKENNIKCTIKKIINEIKKIK